MGKFKNGSRGYGTSSDLGARDRSVSQLARTCVVGEPDTRFSKRAEGRQARSSESRSLR